jgi:predicted amidophosphoribosyltransferase
MEGRHGDVADTMTKAIGRAARCAARAVFPHHCVGCRREGSVLCDACAVDASAKMPGVSLCPACTAPSPFGAPCSSACRDRSALDGVLAAGRYATPLLQALLRDYKYAGIDEAGARLRSLFGCFLDAHAALLAPYAGATVVPVPMHPLRLALRGFNQADLFGREVARAVGGRVDTRMLRRGFSFATQASRPEKERRRSAISGTVSHRGIRPDGPCIVVDDVYTTGATVRACALALRRAGAERVYGLTVLRG